MFLYKPQSDRVHNAYGLQSELPKKVREEAGLVQVNPDEWTENEQYFTIRVNGEVVEPVQNHKPGTKAMVTALVKAGLLDDAFQNGKFMGEEVKVVHVYRRKVVNTKEPVDPTLVSNLVEELDLSVKGMQFNFSEKNSQFSVKIGGKNLPYVFLNGRPEVVAKWVKENRNDLQILRDNLPEVASALSRLQKAAAKQRTKRIKKEKK